MSSSFLAAVAERSGLTAPMEAGRRFYCTHTDCLTSARKFASAAALAMHVQREHGWEFLPCGTADDSALDSGLSRLSMAQWQSPPGSVKKPEHAVSSCSHFHRLGRLARSRRFRLSSRSYYSKRHKN